MYAVIKTGGKQYRVAPNDVIEIEKLAGEVGETIAFDEVLLVGGDGELRVGTPTLAGAHVAAEIVAQGRGPKIIVFKKKRRKNYRRKKGHRQELTTVRITEIVLDGQRPAPKKEPARRKASEEAKPSPETAKTAESTETAKKAETTTAALFERPAGEPDDLTKIKGVGPVIVKKLHDLGIITFDQIANLTPEQIAEVDKRLNFKGRIEREDWIGQAKKLARGEDG